MNAVLADKPASNVVPVKLTPETASANAIRYATEAAETADSIVVDSADMYQIAATELQALTARRKSIEGWRLSITRPMDEAKSKVMALFRAPIENIERAETKIKRAMIEFTQKENARIAQERAEQERVAREERLANEARAREAEQAAADARELAAAALESGDTAVIEAALEAEQTATAAVEVAHTTALLAEVAPAGVVEESGAKASGISQRANWKAELTDLRALVIAAAKAAEAGDETLLGYLTHQQTALNGVARSLKARASVPGVRFWNDAGLSVRTK